jgi:hypothetical protein
MKRMFFGSLAALLALATVIAATASAKNPKPKPNQAKTGVCHKGAGTSAAHPYAAIVVSTKAALSHHMQHPADVIVSSTISGATPLPAGMTLKRFCRTLTPLTTKGGGTLRSATLRSTTTGLSGSLNIRMRLGQGQLCYSLSVTSTTSPVTVTSASLTQGTTTVALTLPTASSGPSLLTLTNCINVSRTTVKSLLKGGAPITVTVSTSAGTLTGTIG